MAKVCDSSVAVGPLPGQLLGCEVHAGGGHNDFLFRPTALKPGRGQCG
jgi:hypothetical protein